MIEITGVIPEPAAKKTKCRSAPRSAVKRPSGALASILAPGRSASLAKVEKRPPSTLLTAILSSPSSAPEQIE